MNIIKANLIMTNSTTGDAVHVLAYESLQLVHDVAKRCVAGLPDFKFTIMLHDFSN